MASRRCKILGWYRLDEPRILHRYAEGLVELRLSTEAGFLRPAPRLCAEDRCEVDVSARRGKDARCDDHARLRKKALKKAQKQRVRQQQARYPDCVDCGVPNPGRRCPECRNGERECVEDGCTQVTGPGLARCTANGSIDRIDNTRGYVAGNWHVVCAGDNGRKRDLTLDELAEGKAGENWAAFAKGYLAENRARPVYARRLVRRQSAA